MQETVDLKDHMVRAFATPIISYPWKNNDRLNQQLGEIILRLEKESAGMQRSNVGSWHSSVDLLQREDGAIVTLRHRAQSLVQTATQAITLVKGASRSFNLRLEGWANVTRRNGYNTVHNHPNCLWSGVYYVSSGKTDLNTPDVNGKLELLDPRVGANMQYFKDSSLVERYLIEPVPGLMVMFPSWLQHLVHPFFGDGERISVAFNAVIVEKPATEQM